MHQDVFYESENENSLLDEREENQTKKTKKNNGDTSLISHKNKYVNKIKDMKPEGDKESQEKKDIYSSSAKSIDKKERNKQAAKNSRDRKKIYIEIMQEKQKALQKQLANKKKQLEESKNYYERIVSQNKTMSSFTASRHQMIKNLQFIVDKGEVENPDEVINEIINSLRSRIGATGKQRINTINQYFRQIVNLSLPALHRYMMWSAAEGKHLFSDHEEEQAENQQWFKELKLSLNLSEQQKIQIKNKKKFLQEQKILLEKLIDELKEVKEDIQNKSIQLEDIIDGIRETLTPIQCAHFILFIEKNKYRKELNLCDNNNDDETPQRKILKKQI